MRVLISKTIGISAGNVAVSDSVADLKLREASAGEHRTLFSGREHKKSHSYALGLTSFLKMVVNIGLHKGKTFSLNVCLSVRKPIDLALPPG